MQQEPLRHGSPIGKSRETADELRKAGDFGGAAELYSAIWPDGDRFTGWALALCLRKLKRTADAIQVASAVFELDPMFRLGRSVYAWALFDEIRGISELTDTALGNARQIVRLCAKDETRHTVVSPFVPTILHVSRLLSKKGRHDQVLRCLELLDESQLATGEYAFVDASGKQRRLASQKEKYFGLKTIALEKLTRWEECLAIAETALTVCASLHHDNDIWFARRAALAKSHLGQSDQAIADLTRLAARKQASFIFVDIAKVAWGIGKHDVVFTHCVRALEGGGEITYKLPALLLISRVLWNRGEQEQARTHLALYFACRVENGWPIRAQATALAAEWGMSVNQLVSSPELLRTLRPIWRSWAGGDADDRRDGTVHQVLPHGKAGFIIAADRQRYYFETREWKDRRRKPTPGSRVTFTTRPSFDKKHQRETLVACDIRGAA